MCDARCGSLLRGRGALGCCRGLGGVGDGGGEAVDLGVELLCKDGIVGCAFSCGFVARQSRGGPFPLKRHPASADGLGERADDFGTDRRQDVSLHNLVRLDKRAAGIVLIVRESDAPQPAHVRSVPEFATNRRRLLHLPPRPKEHQKAAKHLVASLLQGLQHVRPVAIGAL